MNSSACIKCVKFLICSVIFSIIFLHSSLTKTVFAETVSTSVTVGNSGPAFTAGPAESTASDTTTPTNAGSTITFQATATDSNGDNYYLAICKTNSITPTNNSAPTCGGGSWCISGSIASASQASCNYETLSGDSETNAWYAFVCDHSSSSSCSTSSQGSGGTGSPFEVNHAPAFTASSNSSPYNPGQTVTWTSTASDPDTSGVSDTVKLLVCKTAGISAGACDGGGGDTWCSSSLSASDPTCDYALPTPTPDTTYNAYVYIVDSHNFASSGVEQGADTSYVVNNIAPVVSAVTINSGSAIDLSEGTTTPVVLTATITDNNSCDGGEIASVLGYAYRSGKGYGLCDTAGEADDNFCYSDITCTVSGGTCTGTTDASATYTCTANLKSFADPTDVATQYPTENWLSTIKATDDDAETDALEVSTGVELNSLTAMDITGAIAFGSLGAGQKNDPLDKTTTITQTGNVGLDVEVSGTDMSDGQAHTITVDKQKYSLTSSTAYASGSILTTSATEIELNATKPTSATPTTKDVWWGIEIPLGTVPGSYSGSNTVTAIKGETVNW